jgi:Mn-dependent DtxR family transcriptional regulator
MITSTEVFGKIKEMSKRTYGAQNRILLHDIADALSISSDLLLVMVIELQNRGLIIIHKTSIVSVSLTNYGVQEDNPPGGFNSA